jgi:hypothetical protein
MRHNEATDIHVVASRRGLEIVTACGRVVHPFRAPLGFAAVERSDRIKPTCAVCAKGAVTC